MIFGYFRTALSLSSRAGAFGRAARWVCSLFPRTSLLPPLIEIAVIRLHAEIELLGVVGQMPQVIESYPPVGGDLGVFTSLRLPFRAQMVRGE